MTEDSNVTVRAAGWIAEIDHYGVETKSTVKLLNENNRAKLFEGCPEEPKKNAREAFLVYLDNVMRNQEAANPKDNSKTITMEQLLGKEGVKLYKEAIAEERDSKAFREAVLERSTKAYDGPKWGERLIMWVGGPSASGKSFGAKGVVEEMAKEIEKTKVDAKNYVVSIDGGVEREVSQMRQMVLQVGLAKGYKGIEDLHKNTKLKCKGKIKKAVLGQHDLHMLIPATFSRGPQIIVTMHNKIKDMMKEGVKVKHAFCCVKAPSGKDNQFRTSVGIMGNSRAWRQQKDGLFPEAAIQMNNKEIGCESKVYEAENFNAGVKFSNIAEKLFIALVGPENVMTIRNDRIFLKQNENSQWVKLERGEVFDERKHVAMAARDYEKWKQEPNSAPDLKKWIENQGKLSGLDIQKGMASGIEKKIKESVPDSLTPAIQAITEVLEKFEGVLKGAIDSHDKGEKNKISESSHQQIGKGINFVENQINKLQHSAAVDKLKDKLSNVKDLHKNLGIILSYAVEVVVTSKPGFGEKFNNESIEKIINEQPQNFLTAQVNHHKEVPAEAKVPGVKSDQPAQEQASKKSKKSGR